MNDSRTRSVLSLALAAGLVLTGCAAIRRAEAPSTEDLLTAAGFVMRPVNSPEQQQHIAAMSPYRLESRTKDGKPVYSYADPDRCKCLYVGGPKEYSEYRRLRRERRMAEDDARAVQDAMGWAVWGPGWWEF